MIVIAPIDPATATGPAAELLAQVLVLSDAIARGHGAVAVVTPAHSAP